MNALFIRALITEKCVECVSFEKCVECARSNHADIRHKAVNYTKKEFFHLFYTLFVACENSVFFVILMIGPGICKKISAF